MYVSVVAPTPPSRPRARAGSVNYRKALVRHSLAMRSGPLQRLISSNPSEVEQPPAMRLEKSPTKRFGEEIARIELGVDVLHTQDTLI